MIPSVNKLSPSGLDIKYDEISEPALKLKEFIVKKIKSLILWHKLIYIRIAFNIISLLSS